MLKTKTPTSRIPSLNPVDHASSETQGEAKQLLEQTGAPELARQEVASAVGHPAAPTPANDAFAQRWGFASYLSMFEASKPIAEILGRHWLVTNVGPDQWILWNDQELRASRTFKTLDEAKRFVQPEPHAHAPEDIPPTG